ncbi:preprotein translocase subunit SecG [Desulfosporosinus burensis]|uniref:preprotein translocase subunit SecG n=1 Tax=Desulfosporosinus sp. BICA1-9 TaxID=1531958 RepID=UPI00054B63BA|nr:preprotein translocase subunit SecG [Desulfosporosinus sp. BICA1-9]KJS49351.1 MAG: preprotein translocase subunit SecG [Peptococcaceae bacterium BRH_c23]KJS86065.1 MAG: preprotein translocase subunit SecG [Desulfosporosinus sp. BICA1-9]HBW34915.1 preprotein translocase subunit SecG [Desulfosporosinus sp.]
MQIALVILLILSSLGLIAAVLLQSGRSAGLSGAITGAGESIFGKKKGMDELFAKLTGVLAGVFLLSSLGLAMIA